MPSPPPWEYPKVMNTKVGAVIHYYDKICVAIIQLTGTLKNGDRVKFLRNEEAFEQVVTSMQIDHAPVATAKKRDVIGVKVGQAVKEGADVFLVSTSASPDKSATVRKARGASKKIAVAKSSKARGRVKVVKKTAKPRKKKANVKRRATKRHRR